MSAALLSPAVSSAQTRPATAPVVPPTAAVIDPSVYGDEGWNVPPAVPKNATRPRTVDLLKAQLALEEGLHRAQYIMEIGQCKLPSGLDAIKNAMADSDPHMRAQGLRSAGTIGDKSLQGDVEKLLGDPDAEVRREAVIAACTIDGAHATDSVAVLKGLDDADPTVVIAALQYAKTAGEADAIAARTMKMQGIVQLEAINALGRLHAAKHADMVAGFLNQDIAQKISALDSLRLMQARQHAAAVIALQGDKHPSVRRQAVTAMGALSDVPTQQQRALAMMLDNDPSVRTAAATILSDHPIMAAIPLLKKSLYDSYLPLHDAARPGLARPISPEMRQAEIELAAPMLDDPDPRRREDASYILGEVRSDARLERHLELTRFPTAFTPGKPMAAIDWGVVTQACHSLGRIANPKAGPEMYAIAKLAPATMDEIKFATHVIPPMQTIKEAFVAAGQMGYTPVLSESKRLMAGPAQEQDGNMRASAIWALAYLTDKSDAATNQALAKVLGNQMETLGKFEASKALAWRGYKPALPALKTVSTKDPDAYGRFGAWWAVVHLTGEKSVYVPPDQEWTADVSVQDLTEK